MSAPLEASSVWGNPIAFAQWFIEALTGSPDGRVTFQTFDDNKERKDGRLAHVYHGTLAEHADKLTRLNKDGAGIFVTVNETNLKGRTAGDILAVRAVFCDFDDGPADSYAVEPSFIVYSVRGPQPYWLLEPGSSVEEFRLAQQQLAAFYGSDPAVHDPSRVMRLPGFFHCKGEPVMVTGLRGAGRRQSLREVLAAHPAKVAPRVELIRDPDVPIPFGQHDTTLFRLACRYAAKRYEIGDARRLILADARRCVGAIYPDDSALEKVERAYREYSTGELITLSPISGQTILSTEYPPINFIVPGMLAEGLVLLAGRPKIGKSFMALNLAVAVSAGGVFLGRHATAQGGVLYLALEDTERRIKKRLLDFGLAAIPDSLYFLFKISRLDAGGAKSLDDYMTAHKAVKLVVVDVLNKVKSGRSKGADSYQHDADQISLLQTIAMEHGATLLVLTHDRKAGSEDWLDMVTGTLGIAGTADSIARLERNRSTRQARLQITGRDHEDQDLGVEMGSNGIWQVVGPGATVGQSPERQKILAALPLDGSGPGHRKSKDGTSYSHPPGKTPKELAEDIDVDHNTIKKALPAMEASGLVRSMGGGRYVRLHHLSGEQGSLGRDLV